MSDNVGHGVLASFLLHFCQLIIAVLAMMVSATVGERQGYGMVVMFGTFLLIGVSQLIYQVPAFVIARRRGWTAFAQGIAIGTGITFLLNAACWGTIGFGVGLPG